LLLEQHASELVVALLSLSRYLTFHARGDAAFVWHGLTGDVAEMSRDVLALLLCFSPAAEENVVGRAPPAGLTRDQVEQFVPILRARRMLVLAPSGGQKVDEISPLLAGYPRVPRVAVYFRHAALGKPLEITVYDRDGKAVKLDEQTAQLFDRCDGEHTLGQVLADAGPAALEPLMRMASADVAALKILPKKVSEGGMVLNPAAESTMPYPELPDVRAYAAGGAAPGPAPEDLRAYHEGIQDADAQFDETETTLAHLFREPHPSLKGKTFGAALSAGLLLRGALRNQHHKPVRLLEVGGGLGYVGRAFRDALSAAPEASGGLKAINIDLSPALARAQKKQGLAVALGDALQMPSRAESFDLILSNEMVGDLGTSVDPNPPAPEAPPEPPPPPPRALEDEGDLIEESPQQPAPPKRPEQSGPPEEKGPRMINDGAVKFVRDAAELLAPGGMLYISEFGDPTADPVRSTHLDHDEWSIRFSDLQAAATAAGLGARVVSLADVLNLDGSPQALMTTRSSYAALRALFRDHGFALTKRAWLRTEIEAMVAGKLDLSEVRGLQWAPLGERTMGLHPKQFWALVATKPARTLH
jgi:SAM-dependent methyltransferase